MTDRSLGKRSTIKPLTLREFPEDNVTFDPWAFPSKPPVAWHPPTRDAVETASSASSNENKKPPFCFYLPVLGDTDSKPSFFLGPQHQICLPRAPRRKKNVKKSTGTGLSSRPASPVDCKLAGDRVSKGAEKWKADLTVRKFRPVGPTKKKHKRRSNSEGAIKRVPLGDLENPVTFVSPVAV